MNIKTVGFTATSLMLIAVVAFPVSSTQRQTARSGRVHLSVLTVRLGSSYSQVRSHLPRPTSDTTRRDDSLGSIETIRTLQYSGLMVTLQKSHRSKIFSVVAISVTSPLWRVAPGVEVGSTAEQVKARLGAPYEESDEGNRHRYHYLNATGGGFALLEFENNRLVALSWSYDLS
jgi:hypothetical protein